MFAHIGPHRQTRDVDFVIASSVNEDELLRKGYKKFRDRKETWYSPRNVKIDIFTRDVNRIEITKILDTSVAKPVGKNTIRVMSLELLLLSKFRAGREQDIQDIQEICIRQGEKVRLEELEELATEIEVTNLRNTIIAFSGMSKRTSRNK